MIRFAAFAPALALAACLDDPNDAPKISEAQIQALTFEMRLASYHRFDADRDDTLPKTIAAADTASRRILRDEQVSIHMLIGNLPPNVKMEIRTYAITSSNGVAQPVYLQSLRKLNLCCSDKGGETRIQSQLTYFPNSTATPYKQILFVEIGGRERFRDSVRIL